MTIITLEDEVMKRRKVMAFAMAAVMAMSMVTGCGNKTDEGTGSTPAGSQDAATVQDVSLKVWVPEEDLEITQEMCDKFNEAHPEYNCTIEVAVVGVDDALTQLKNDPELAADVFMMPSAGISEVKEAGLLYPITADIDTVKSLYGEGAIEACTRDGELYGVPVTPNAWFVYYNKSLFTEDDVKSLDTMLEKDLGQAEDGEDIKNFSCTISNSWYIEAFFYGAGCTLYGEDGTDPEDCSWNDETGVAVGEYLIDLANNDKYVEDLEGVAGSLFKEGKLGALCSGTWSAPDLKEALGDDLGACALPAATINGKECQLSNFADYKCFAVKSSTASPLAAQQLAEYLSNEENQMLRYQTSATSPTCLSLMDSEELAADVATSALIAQTQYATPQPSIAQINEYWTPVSAFGEGIINGDITKDNVKEKLDVVVDSITSKLVD